MPNPLQMAGSQGRPVKYVPLFTNRFWTGLWTQRNVLRDAASSYQVERFYGPRMDALIDGSNMEITNSLTMRRRPGLSVYNSQTFSAIDSFYSFRTFTTATENIRVVADTAAAVYDATGPSTKQTIFSKGAGSGQSYFQSVGNELFWGDGLEQKKWLYNPWKASSTYYAGGYVTDTSYNVQQVAAGRLSAGYAITNVSITANVLTLTTTGFPTRPDGSAVAIGDTMTFAGVGTATFLNGAYAAVLSLPVAAGGGSYTFTLTFSHTTYASAADTGSIGYVLTGVSGVSGSSAPAWSAVVGGMTIDNNLIWVCKGSAIQNWGIATPAAAPTVANASLPNSIPSWVALTFYSTSLLLLDSNGNIQKLTTAGTTGAAAPVWSAVVGNTTADNTAVWTCQGPSAWASLHAYATGAYVVATWSVQVWVSSGGPLPCFTPDTEIKTPEGVLRLPLAKAGMLALVDGKTRRIRKVLVHDYDGDLYRIPGTEWGVTPEHLIRHNGWVPAEYLFHDKFHYTGRVYNLEMDTEVFDDKCYELANGLVAHNMKALDSTDTTSTGYWTTVNYSSFFRCTTAGTSGSTAPTWGNGSVTDGTVVWKNIGTTVVWSTPGTGQIAIGANTLVSLTQQIVDTNNNLQNISGTGKSGAAAPVWQTALSSTTSDGTAQWTNGGASPSVANTAAWLYAFSFGNSSTQHFSTASPLSSAVTLAAQSYIAVQGNTSADAQVDTIRIWRTKQGGATLFFNADIAMPTGSTWSYSDTLPDSGLNVLISAPISSSNNPPPSGLAYLTYHLGRIWGAVGNTVYYSDGPNTLVGSGNEAFPPLNYFVYPSAVRKLWPCSFGLLVFTVSDIYIIAGQGTTNSILYTYPFLEGIGLLSYNAFTVNGSIAMLMTGDSQTVALDPSSGVSEVGFPIGDKLAAFSPSGSYLTWHVSGSQDKALYVADGSTGWYRLNPTSAPESGQTWNPFATLSGGCSAVRSIEVTPGVRKLLVGPATSGPILQRDLTVFSDNGTAYTCFATVGSIILAHPSEIAHVLYITTECVAAGTRPTLSVLMDEIGPPATFEVLADRTWDPPQMAPSQSLYSDRFYMSATQQPAMCRHMQLKFSFPAEVAANELLTYTVVGAHYAER